MPLPSLNAKYLAAYAGALTAAIGLDKSGQIKAGDKVFITAAAGGTGHIAVQWAKRKGCYVIASTSSNEKGDKLKKLGADDVINYREQNLDQVLSEKYPVSFFGNIFRKLFNDNFRKASM